MASPSVLIFGATGYLGGSVLVTLQRRHPTFSYTALVRNPKDSPALQVLGIKVVEGYHEEIETVKLLAQEHDVVINLADADGLALVRAILEGLTARAQSPSVRKPVFIQTSGTALLTPGFSVEYDGSSVPGEATRVWDDNKPADVEEIPAEAPHRVVDLAVFEAQRAGFIDTYIIAPSIVYGKGLGPVRKLTIAIPWFIRIAIKERAVFQIGPGTNVWNAVHVQDLSDLYVLVLDSALSVKESEADPFRHFYFGSIEEISLGEIARGLAKALYAKGLVDSPDPRSIAPSDKEADIILKFMASNARSVANRSLALGWKPKARPLAESLEEEVEYTLPLL